MYTHKHTCTHTYTCTHNTTDHIAGHPQWRAEEIGATHKRQSWPTAGWSGHQIGEQAHSTTGSSSGSTHTRNECVWTTQEGHVHKWCSLPQTLLSQFSDSAELQDKLTEANQHSEVRAEPWIQSKWPLLQSGSWERSIETEGSTAIYHLGTT